MNTNKNQEKGQALVLIAFAFVALIGFTALAIDGGMLYSNRRHAQNATDAGSLGGGGAAALSLENDHVFYASFTCGSADVNAALSVAENAAENLMLANDYELADITITTDCQDSDGNYFEEKYIDITTQIIKETKTSLIHFVYDGPVFNLVDATTRIKPRSPMAFGHAVVALNDNSSCSNSSKDGVVFSGSGSTHINGGGVWSNGCLKSTNNACEVGVDNGSIMYGGGSFGDMCGGNMSPSPGFQNEQLPVDAYSVPTPNCGASGAVTVSSISKDTDLNAAYPGKSLICVTSSGNAIKITSGYLYGDGITIYLVNGGDIEISGGDVNLSAPSADPDPDPGLPGILFYVNPVRDSVINLNGNNDSKYLGVILAPKADVSVTGSNGTYPTFNTQIIGWNVEISGNATVDINFNQTWAYSKPTSIDLEE
jgi:hypothetical protein